MCGLAGPDADLTPSPGIGKQAGVEGGVGELAVYTGLTIRSLSVLSFIDWRGAGSRLWRVPGARCEGYQVWAASPLSYWLHRA